MARSSGTPTVTASVPRTGPPRRTFQNAAPWRWSNRPPGGRNRVLGADAFFDFDKYTCPPDAPGWINWLPTCVGSNRSPRSKIVGHTDSKGTEAYNYRLGQRRADTVANYLTARGVPSSIITTSSRGNSIRRPNTLPNGRTIRLAALNRRVVITVTAMEHVISQ